MKYLKEYNKMYVDEKMMNELEDIIFDNCHAHATCKECGYSQDVEFDKGNSRDIFHHYRGVYCDKCVAEIVNNYNKEG